MASNMPLLAWATSSLGMGPSPAYHTMREAVAEGGQAHSCSCSQRALCTMTLLGMEEERSRSRVICGAGAAALMRLLGVEDGQQVAVVYRMQHVTQSAVLEDIDSPCTHVRLLQTWRCPQSEVCGAFQ
jgi:hypothetical protein